MENIRNKNTRLLVEIPEVIHKKIRMLAAEENISLKAWLMRIIIQYLRDIEEDNEKRNI